MYFLGVDKALTVKIMILFSHSSTEASISVRSRRLFCKAICPLGAHFQSVVWKSEVVHISKVGNAMSNQRCLSILYRQSVS